jgi:hypothetical protein
MTQVYNRDDAVDRRQPMRRVARAALTYEDLGWTVIEVDSDGAEDGVTCPRCGEPPVASLHHYWDRINAPILSDDTCWSVDHYWCMQNHMWVVNG